MDSQCKSIRCGLENLFESIAGTKVFGVDWWIYPAMLPQSKRLQEAEHSDSAPKRIRGLVVNWGKAGFEADVVMRSHCSTWHNTSLKEPSEDAEPYPWRLEPASAPLPVGLIALRESAMITKCDLMLVVFSRDETKAARQALLDFGNILARDASEREVHDHRDRPTQRVHARDHQSLVT